METKQPILEVKNLKQYFKVNRKFTVKAVDDISFASIQKKPMDL